MRDGISGIQVKRVISPVSVSNNTAQVGQIIDRQGYETLSFLILYPHARIHKMNLTEGVGA